MPRAIRAVRRLYARGWSPSLVQVIVGDRWRLAKSSRAAERLALMYEASYLLAV